MCGGVERVKCCRTDLFIKLALPADLLGVPYRPLQTPNDAQTLTWA